MIVRTLIAALSLAAPFAASNAIAQAWPSKLVRIVVPFAPGGTTDTEARMLAKKYTDSLGQSFVVENRVGASGMIGTESCTASRSRRSSRPRCATSSCATAAT
jgi:tripartite-type tricarboxylate transporter receptor subunit TctC